ncbi:MAG: hypothetical protein ACRDSS_11790, partial [Actinocrinis sp.]
MTDSQSTFSPGNDDGGGGDIGGGSAQVWPIAHLDRVRRMRVLAAGVHAPYAEGRIDAPFETVWAALADLDSSIPLMVTDVRTFRVTERGDDSSPAVAAA